MEGMQTDAVPPVDVNARSEPDTAPQPLNPAAPTAPTEIPPPVRDEAATDAAPVRPRTPSARTRAHTTRPPARRTSLRVQRVHARSLLDAAAVSPDYGDATDVAVTATTDWGSASVDTPVLADTDSAELVPGELEPLPSPWDPPEHTHAVSTARGPAAIARPPSLPASEALTAGLSLAPAPTVPAGPPGRPHLEILSEPSDIALPQGRIFSLDEPGPPPMPLPLPPLVQPAQRIFAARQPMIVREADATTDLEEDPLDSADTAFSVAAGPSRPRRTRGSVARGKPPLPAPVDQGPPAWLLGIALFVLLSLSAMLGFYLATRGETIIVDAPTSMERSPRR